jgi:hypothetical protein
LDPLHFRISCPPFGSSANFNASGMRSLDTVSENLLGPSRKKTIE